jgi:hypothetical protein
MAPKALKSTVLSLALLYPSRFDESVVEHDGELGLGLAPFAWWHFPCLRNLAQDEIEQFDRSLIGWKMVSHSHGAPQFGVQGFDGVRGVNDAPHSDGKGEERDDMLPVAPPALRDCRIFAAPDGGVESSSACGPRPCPSL